MDIVNQVIPHKHIMLFPSISQLTPNLIQKINRRNSCYHHSKCQNNPYYLQKYKSLSNKVIINLRAAKRTYFIPGATSHLRQVLSGVQ